MPSYTRELQCFVVCADRTKLNDPLYVAVDLNSKAAFDRAKSFLKGFKSPQAVLCRGRAELNWSQKKPQHQV
jgi:hypothetical protein